MNFDVAAHTVLLCRHGSHAYGLETPESDLDLRGICIEPPEFVISFCKNFEQSENVKFNGYEESKDCTIFGLRKFLNLAANANPNVIEILFVEENEIIFATEFGRKIIDNKELFLTKKAYHTFGGYAKGQLKRLENHRQWIINPPPEPCSRTEFGLPASPVIPSDQIKAAFAAINKKIDQWNLKDMTDIDRADRIEFINAMAEVIAEMQLGAKEQFIAAGNSLGFDTNFLVMLDKERTYNGIKQLYSQYQNWLKTRNPKRFKTEQECLVDTKHASHLIRLYFEAIDLLNGNGLILKRPKDELNLLLDIKLGKFGKETYKMVMDLKEDLNSKLDDAMKNSKLPHGPDVNKMDDLMRTLYKQFWKM